MPSIPSKKIAHFGKYYLPDVGGIESVTATVAEGAAQAGHQVSVICFEGEPAPREEVLCSVQVVRARRRITVASQPLSLDYVRKALRSARHADIVHLHAPNMLAALCSLMLRPHVKLLVHWHADVRNKGLLGFIGRPLERLLLRRTSTVVVTTEIYGKTSPALARFQDKLTVVPNGVSDPWTAGDGATATLPSNWSERLSGRRLVLSVGRLVPFKGFDVLIDAARDLPDDVAVVIVGDGPARVDLQARVDRHGLAGKVYLAGLLPGCKTGGVLHHLYRRADLYCLPSVDRSESFGVVLIEAMSYGTPCLVSDIPGSGVTWVSQDGVSGARFPVGDAPALAAAALRLLNDPAELARLGRSARQRYLDLFTAEVATRRMLAAYESLT